MKIKDYKAGARASLCGNYGTLIGAQLISGLLQWVPVIAVAAVLFLGIGGRVLSHETEALGTGAGVGLMAVTAILAAALLIAALFLGFLLNLGLQFMYLNICRGEKPALSDLFSVFRREMKTGRFVRALLLLILLIVLWYLFLILTILGGIVLAPEESMQLPLVAGIVCVWLIVLLYVSLGLAPLWFVLLDHPELGARAAFTRSFRLMKGRRLRYLLMYVTFIFWGIPNYLSFQLTALWINPYIICTLAMFYLDAAGERGGVRQIPEAAVTGENTEEAAEKRDGSAETEDGAPFLQTSEPQASEGEETV